MTSLSVPVGAASEVAKYGKESQWRAENINMDRLMINQQNSFQNPSTIPLQRKEYVPTKSMQHQRSLPKDLVQPIKANIKEVDENEILLAQITVPDLKAE